jgi:hypothetical protein
MSQNTSQKILQLALLASVALLPGVQSFGGTFDQNEVCRGKDSVVLKSDGDAGADPDGWFVYSGSLIFCCEGNPYDVMCSEMMEG